MHSCVDNFTLIMVVLLVFLEPEMIEITKNNPLAGPYRYPDTIYSHIKLLLCLHFATNMVYYCNYPTQKQGNLLGE